MLPKTSLGRAWCAVKRVIFSFFVVLTFSLTLTTTLWAHPSQPSLASTLDAVRPQNLKVTSHVTSPLRDPGLPNATKTPGVTNLQVTQGTIGSTICVSGYTKTIRPPSSYTTNLKIAQLHAGYNYHGDLSTHDYEEDHLVPLEVGGSPSSVKNLWPEPRLITWNAALKDRLENKLHAMVCSHQISLAAAQHVFMTNWIQGYRTYEH